MATTDISLMDLDELLDPTSGYILINKGGSDYRVPVGLFMLAANNLSEGTVSNMRSSLKLDEYIKYGSAQVGALMFWPSAQMPNEIFTDMTQEFLPYMGQSFDGVRYPMLAKIHTSLKLPVDMRGEFIRGWDNGRGVDNGRTIMTAQQATLLRTAMMDYTGFDNQDNTTLRPAGLAYAYADADKQNAGGSSGNLPIGGATAFRQPHGVAGTSSPDTGVYNGDNAHMGYINQGGVFNATNGVQYPLNWIASRPRNVAWNMIVRAK